MLLFMIVMATLLVSLISLVGVLFIWTRVDVRRITFYLISLASGTMLGGAFFDLIPESMESSLKNPLVSVALGVFMFFILEKFLIWRHCHHHQRPEEHRLPLDPKMIIVGDTIHNFIDGVIIASSFLASPAIGISVTLAIIFHEIPQEIGDFGVLIYGGYSVQKALYLNLLSALASVLGGILAFFFLEFSTTLQAMVIPFAAGGFLYIALADLIPQLHEQIATAQTVAQIGLLGGGFGLMALLKHVFG